MAELPLVSVLIGTRNRGAPLLRCLESVLRSDCPPLEVLVLDDCSDGLDVCELISTTLDDPRITCFRSENQWGVPGGRNFLMGRALGEILFVMDDDAVLTDGDDIRRAAAILNRAPEIGILAFKVINHESGGARLRTPFSQLARRRSPHISERRQLVSYYLGTAHAMRRELFERCGPYQGDFLFGEEELDLSYSAIREGYKILYVPSIVVHHYPQASVVEGELVGRSVTELELHIRNRIWLAFKHLPFPYLVTSLSVWLAFYASQAVRSFQPGAYVRGMLAGVRGLSRLPRRPLDRCARTYLRSHYGRLWY
jgi:GT2 family glycosyltransferase